MRAGNIHQRFPETAAESQCLLLQLDTLFHFYGSMYHHAAWTGFDRPHMQPLPYRYLLAPRLRAVLRRCQAVAHEEFLPEALLPLRSQGRQPFCSYSFGTRHLLPQSPLRQNGNYGSEEPFCPLQLLLNQLRHRNYIFSERFQDLPDETDIWIV